MSVTQGNVKIRVELTGNGDSATLAVKVVREEIDKTTRSTDALKGATDTLGAKAGVAVPKLQSVASTASVITSKLSGMSSAIIGGVIGAAGSGVIGAVTSLVGSLADLVVEFLDTEPRIDSFGVRMIEGAQNSRELAAALGDVQKSVKLAGDAVTGFGSRMATLNAKLATLRGDAQLATQYTTDAAVAAAGDEIKGIEAKMKAAEDAANKAQRIVSDQRPKLEAARLEVVAAKEALELRKQQGQADAVQHGRLFLAIQNEAMLRGMVQETANQYGVAERTVAAYAEELARLGAIQEEIAKGPAEGPTKPKPTQGPAQVTRPGPAFAYHDIGAAVDRRPRPIGIPSSGGPDEEPDYIADMSDATTTAEDFATALQGVAEATSLVAERMPEMGAALAEVQGITASLTAGKMKLGEALAAGAVAIGANAARAIGGVRAEAAVRAAYEFGMGWATLEAPPISAGHFLASGLLAAVAGGAGKGSSGGSAASSHTSPRSTRVSTATTLGEAPLVQNINAPWFGGLQEGGAYVWEMGRRAAGTGYSEAA